MRRALLLLTATVVIAATAAILVLRSDWLRNEVRQRIASTVERGFGGRVEVGNFDYDWRHMTATVAPFVLHGAEPAGQPPLFRAAKLTIGLRLVSLIKPSVDLAFLVVDRPEVHVTVSADGHTNIPPPTMSPADVIRDLVVLRVEKFIVQDGYAEYNTRRIPLDIKGEGLKAYLQFDKAAKRYYGEISSRALHLRYPGLPEASVQFESALSMSTSRLDVTKALFAMGDSNVALSGNIENPASPRGSFNVTAFVKPHVAYSGRGEAGFNGTLKFASEPVFDWELEGRAEGKDLEYRSSQLRMEGIHGQSQVRLRGDLLDLTRLSVANSKGSFRGQIKLTNWKNIEVSGETGQVSLLRVAGVSSTASGPVQATAVYQSGRLHDLRASAKLTIEPHGAGALQGVADLNFDQSSGRIAFGPSQIALGTTHVELSGVAGQKLEGQVVTGNLDEVRKLLQIVHLPLKRDLPVALKGGTARFQGSVSGPLDDPEIAGLADFTKVVFQGEEFDHAAANFNLTHSQIRARNLVLSQGPFHLEGVIQAGLTNWQLTGASPIGANVSLRGAQISSLLKHRNWDIPASGILAGTADIKGTYGDPQAAAGIDAENVIAFDEHIPRIRASVVVTGNLVRVVDATIGAPTGPILAKGSYEHAPDDWSTGRLELDASARTLALSKIAHVEQMVPGAEGDLAFNATGTARFNKGVFRLETVTSQATLRNGTYKGRRYGTAVIAANTQGPILKLRTNVNLLGTPIEGSGEWRLEGDDPGHGEIVIPKITIATLHQLIPEPRREQLPFEGFVEGKVDIDGPLRKPEQLKAAVRINTVQINASGNVQPKAGAQARDLILRNTKPILLDATTKGVEIRNAQLAGTGTTLDAQGRLAFESKSPWDLKLKGTVNLGTLQMFNPDLLGSGISTLDVTIRGPLWEPQVDGRLDLKNASLYLTDLPNGLDQANGVIIFDRSRATVDSLSALTGGGRISIAQGSYVGFRGPVLQYRVQASAEQVRYRSEGVSVTVNALLNLIGTSESSILSGTVTMIRAGFNPTTDIGNLLAVTAKPVSAPGGGNEFFRGMQLDIRVESAQSLQIESSVARSIESEANLRIRGTPDRPVVLGNISVTEGQIEFFGNKYTINRGEVNFYNPVRIEPILDMDLETSVRGITVDISFAGPLNKLNFSYRSDPPLQTNDIIALLAVGRTPQASGIAPTQANTGTSYLSTSSSLLSQAITAPNEGRLQRFFGVSHIKIDPQLTDITSVPQARLTLEQQISKDITLTYITNLARTQEQIIRVEWDLNKQWSVIALRDENGAFGIDFQYRKRFK